MRVDHIESQLMYGKISVDEALALLEGPVAKQNAAKSSEQRLRAVATNRKFPSEGQENINWQAQVELVYRIFGLGPTARLIKESQQKIAGTIYIAQYVYALVDKSPNELEDDGLEYAIDNFHAEQALKLRKIQAERMHLKAVQRIGITREIADDVQEVKHNLLAYGFPATLVGVLDKVENEFTKPQDEFDNNATIKHLRTFYEKLHKHVAKTIQDRLPNTKDGTDLEKFGQARDFLFKKNVGILDEGWKQFANALYGILSDRQTGAHGIASPREFVRLCRNMAIEYAVMLFYFLDERLKTP